MADCFLCGSPATTIDHVPPQSFFESIPANIIKLPACAACNRGASLDEEYIRTTLVALGYARSAVARRIWEGAVKRSFVRRPEGLRARLARDVVPMEVRTPTGEAVGRLPGLAIDGKRSLSVFRKIARGIFFHERAQRLADDELLLFRDADVITKGLDFAISTQRWPEVDMGEPFRYRSVHDPDGSMLWFEFYRITWWLAMTGEAARTYPKLPAEVDS